jgi:hypothetical protein
MGGTQQPCVPHSHESWQTHGRFHCHTAHTAHPLRSSSSWGRGPVGHARPAAQRGSRKAASREPSAARRSLRARKDRSRRWWAPGGERRALESGPVQSGQDAIRAAVSPQAGMRHAVLLDGPFHLQRSRQLLAARTAHSPGRPRNPILRADARCLSLRPSGRRAGSRRENPLGGRPRGSSRRRDAPSMRRPG